MWKCSLNYKLLYNFIMILGCLAEDKMASGDVYRDSYLASFPEPSRVSAWINSPWCRVELSASALEETHTDWIQVNWLTKTSFKNCWSKPAKKFLNFNDQNAHIPSPAHHLSGIRQEPCKGKAREPCQEEMSFFIYKMR